MKMRGRNFFLEVCLFLAGFFVIASARAATINDRSGGAIYWGGKYVNVKPSNYTDSIGRRTRVDQMEVSMNNDIVTVKVTGPYIYNYVHNVKQTREAAPGDLYISSRGWKVSGKPPHTNDVFEASEGWDYVVSFEKKKLYTLNFSKITMTSALSNTGKHRAQQAWRGGYGDFVDDAEVILTARSLSFIFSVRNISLHSGIGVHWTMKCGNDIIEGSVAIPPIAVGPPPADPAAVETLEADPADSEAPVSASAPYETSTAGVTQVGTGVLGYAAATYAAIPVFRSVSDKDYVVLPQSNPVAPNTPIVNPSIINPDGPHVDPRHFDPTTPVPIPSTVILLFTGLAALVARKRLTK